jgi:predicted ester cyclase
MLEPAQLLEFAKHYTAAWCSRDAASVATYYSPHGSLCINDGTPAVGRHSIAEAVQAFMTDFPDLLVVMDNLVMENDRAVYHWTLTGTNTGPRGTGQRVRISGFEVWNLGKDGLIAESQGHFDSAAYQRQLERGVEESH